MLENFVGFTIAGPPLFGHGYNSSIVGTNQKIAPLAVGNGK